MVPAGRITYTQSKFLHEFQTFLALFNAVLERPPISRQSTRIYLVLNT